MSRGRGGRFARGRSDVHAPRSSSEIFTLRGPGGVVIPPSCHGGDRCPRGGRPNAWLSTGGAWESIGADATHAGSPVAGGLRAARVHAARLGRVGVPARGEA